MHLNAPTAAVKENPHNVNSIVGTSAFSTEQLSLQSPNGNSLPMMAVRPLNLSGAGLTNGQSTARRLYSIPSQPNTNISAPHPPQSQQIAVIIPISAISIVNQSNITETPPLRLTLNRTNAIIDQSSMNVRTNISTQQSFVNNNPIQNTIVTHPLPLPLPPPPLPLSLLQTALPPIVSLPPTHISTTQSESLPNADNSNDSTLSNESIDVSFEGLISASEVRKRYSFYDDGDNSGLAWKCPFAHCNKRYAKKRSLDNHFKIHTSDAYVCHCGKRFGRKSNLTEHTRSHSGIKPFQCDICNKSFSQSHCLRDHMRLHSNEKPHICDICGKSFAALSNCRAHRRTHDPNRPSMVCDICGNSFTSKRGLKKHFISKHT